jgi:hypothetical protein
LSNQDDATFSEPPYLPRVVPFAQLKDATASLIPGKRTGRKGHDEDFIPFDEIELGVHLPTQHILQLPGNLDLKRPRVVSKSLDIGVKFPILKRWTISNELMPKEETFLKDLPFLENEVSIDDQDREGLKQYRTWYLQFRKVWSTKVLELGNLPLLSEVIFQGGVLTMSQSVVWLTFSSFLESFITLEVAPAMLPNELWNTPQTLGIEKTSDALKRQQFICLQCDVALSMGNHYVKINDPSSALCNDCFTNSIQVPSFSGSYVWVDPPIIPSSGTSKVEENWTDDEILRLLDAVTHFNPSSEEGWDATAQYVGGDKEPSACLLKFLTLQRESKDLKTEELQQTLPFLDLPNPILSTVHFLAAQLNPGLSAVLARTALVEIGRYAEKLNLNENSNLDQIPWEEILQVGFSEVKRMAQNLAREEQAYFERLLHGTIELTVKRMELKCQQLESICIEFEKEQELHVAEHRFQIENK